MFGGPPSKCYLNINKGYEFVAILAEFSGFFITSQNIGVISSQVFRHEAGLLQLALTIDNRQGLERRMWVGTFPRIQRSVIPLLLIQISFSTRRTELHPSPIIGSPL